MPGIYRVTFQEAIMAHRGKLTACLMVKLRFRLGIYSYCEAVNTQHGVLEYGLDLHVNERQKIRHYRARSTEE